MSHEFRMPDIGEGLTEAEIVTWFVAEGDVVAVDQPIVEVETAKTTVEIPTQHAGTVLRLSGGPGDVVAVGDVLFVIGDPEDAPRQPHGAAAPVAETRTPDAGSPLGAAPSGPAPAAVQAMPVARRLARDLGIDLTGVRGSGRDGAITRADVEHAASRKVTKGAERIEPLTGVRRAIATHMTESWTTIPHVTVQAEIRAEAMLMSRGRQGDDQLPIESLVAMAVMPLLRTHPEFNAAFRDDGIAFWQPINLGFAVDTDAGLMVVVVKEADTRSLPELASDFERLSKAARDRTARPDELTGQTFTISNIGALGGGHGTPIIPVGTSAIVSIGRAKLQPVVESGELAIGTVAPIDLSYDHRIIDGSLGQRFLSALVPALETP